LKQILCTRLKARMSTKIEDHEVMQTKYSFQTPQIQPLETQ